MPRRGTRGAIQSIVTVAVLTVAFVVPWGGVAQANHGTRSLQVTPETASLTTGAAHTVTATLSAAADATSGTIAIDFENENGVNDTDGTSLNTPDRQCSIPSGQTTCTFNYTGTVVGTDTWRGWIDHDGLSVAQGGVTEADTTEGADAADAPNEPAGGTNVPGSSPGGSSCTAAGATEADCTDVVTATWTGGPATRVDCDDATGPDSENETNPGGGGAASNETYSCTTTDAGGTPVGSTQVFGEVENGINDPGGDNAGYNPADYTCTTAAGGSCTITVTQNENETGTADICFWIGTAAQGGDASHCGTEPTNENQAQNLSDTANDAADQVEKTWQTRAATGLDAEPEADTNTLNANHVVTLTVYDQFGAPFQGNTTVNLEFFDNSPSDTDQNDTTPPDRTCITNNSSSCTITYTQATTAGTDVMCAWIGTNPTMASSGTTATCDGEGLTDADDDSTQADPPAPANDDQDVIQKTWQDPNAASRLDCTPETDTNQTGTAHVVTCTATNQTGTVVANTRVDAEATGTNDPDSANSLTSPDFTCTTAANGTCSFTHGPGGSGTTNTLGTTTYRAWIDSDNNNTSAEADQTEAQAEATTAGTKAEPDDTDVVAKTWTGVPATLTVAPTADTEGVGRCNAFTVTAKDSGGNAVSGFTIDVEQTHTLATNTIANDEPTVSFCTPVAADGPNPSATDATRGDLNENPDNVGTAGGETSATTDANGQITIGVRSQAGNGSDGTGLVNLTFFYEGTDNDDPDANEAKVNATKTWEIPDARTIACTPDTTDSPTGAEVTITCAVKNRFGEAVANESVTFTEAGAGDLVGATVKTTDAAGNVSISSNSLQTGVQAVTATLTDDLTGAEPGHNDECDRVAGDPAGAPAGACADASQITWTQPTPANVVVTPTEATNSPGSEVILTATVTSATGTPVAGAAINWSEMGTGTLTDADLTTDANGQAQAVATSPEDRGTQEVEAFTSTCATGSECSDTAELNWGPAKCDIFGTEGNDVITGTSASEFICGFEGHDEINGGGGNDILLGHQHNDELHGGPGSDILKGGAGSDQLFGEGGGDLLAGGRGKDSGSGGAGRDTVKGGKGGDDLEGEGDTDLLVGGGGSDTLDGGAGRDTLRGGRGRDVLDGGPEFDECDGGPGRDAETQCEG